MYRCLLPFPSPFWPGHRCLFTVVSLLFPLFPFPSTTLQADACRHWAGVVISSPPLPSLIILAAAAVVPLSSTFSSPCPCHCPSLVLVLSVCCVIAPPLSVIHHHCHSLWLSPILLLLVCCWAPMIHLASRGSQWWWWVLVVGFPIHWPSAVPSSLLIVRLSS